MTDNVFGVTDELECKSQGQNEPTFSSRQGLFWLEQENPQEVRIRA